MKYVLKKLENQNVIYLKNDLGVNYIKADINVNLIGARKGKTPRREDQEQKYYVLIIDNNNFETWLEVENLKIGEEIAHQLTMMLFK